MLAVRATNHRLTNSQAKEEKQPSMRMNELWVKESVPGSSKYECRSLSSLAMRLSAGDEPNRTFSIRSDRGTGNKVRLTALMCVGTRGCST